MPAGKEKDSDTGTVKRTTFRPPWVKEGPNPSPTPAAPWTLKTPPRKDSSTGSDTSDKVDYNPLAEVQLKPTKVNKKPPPAEENGDEVVRKHKLLAGVQLKKVKKAEPKEPQENGAKESFFQKPALKPVPQREKSPPKKDHKLHNLPTLQKVSDRVLKSPPRKSSLARSDTLTSDEDNVEIDKEIPKKRNALVREASMRKLSQSNIPPPPPPAPGMPPPPPMMPGEVPKKRLTDKQKSKLNKLKARPKNRPDWSNLLQEIESKKALKHVVCNDRSSPLLPEAKTADEHLIYKSEEPNVHNELLKQIEKGFSLKKVKTNDRSKPVLDGLRKFRRQMTIEEQIQKSMSMASIPPEIATDEIDEMDDIDKVRDDLQSTKQMLALELRNKEAQERENKRLQARIQNLQAELEQAKSQNKGGGNNKASNSAADEKVIQGLKKESEEARKTSQELEKKYTQAAEQLDSTKSKMEDLKRQNQMLEKKLQEAMIGKKFSISDRKPSGAGHGSDDELEDEEPEEDSDGEDTEEKREKRLVKEVKMLRKKLQSLKTKEDNARKERLALREIIKKHQTEMKEEKKKYKHLKKEVDKMASLMNNTDEDEEEEEDEEKEAEEEESEEEEESSEEEETESESEDTESEKSQSEDEDAPNDKHKTNLTSRTKRHENILNALKKGNFLLKTNAERLHDDLNKQKEMTASLQEELDSVLSELG